MRRLAAVTLAAIVAVGGYLALSAVAWAVTTATDGSCMALHGDQTPADFRLTSGDTAPSLDAWTYRFTGARDVAFPSLTPGLTIRASWSPPTDPQAGAVILVHGKQSCRRDPMVLVPAGMLHWAGFGVLVLDLRNHGTSDHDNGHWAGGADEWQDVLGAWRWLRDQGFPAASIGLLGQSMGAGAVAFALGHERRIAAAWLDSPYADEYSMAMKVAWDPVRQFFVPGALLVARLVEGDDVLANSPERVFAEQLAGRPVAIVHGTADDTIPVWQGRRLAAAAQAAGSPVDLWILDGVGHVRAAFEQPAEYKRRLVAFFGAHLAARPSSPAEGLCLRSPAATQEWACPDLPGPDRDVPGAVGG